VVRVRNKPALGWQVKTRAERVVPLGPPLALVLRGHVGGRTTGPVFRRRRWTAAGCPLTDFSAGGLARDLERRVAGQATTMGKAVDRAERGRLARRLWADLGAVEEDRVRTEFLRVTAAIGLPDHTAPKALRHAFATALQDGRVDPLIRNLLMGHAAVAARTAGHGLGMTAVYSHSRPETVRQQLEEAMSGRPAVAVAISRNGCGDPLKTGHQALKNGAKTRQSTCRDD
jgi:integrase